MKRAAALLTALLVMGGLSGAVARSASAAQPTSQTSITDPTGDSSPPDPRADITSASMNYWRDAITVTVNVAQWTDPATDPGWSNGSAGIGWDFDVNADGAADFHAVFSKSGGSLVGFVGNVQHVGGFPAQYCNADAVAVNPGYRLSFPAACIGSPSSVGFAATFAYESNGTTSEDRAPDAGFLPPASPSLEAHSHGGNVVDDWGGVHPYNTGGLGPPPLSFGTAYWVGQDVARGTAATFGGGYVLDDWGGIHWYSASSGAGLGGFDGPYWPGQDVARGIALLPSGGGGYVLDEWGGLHPFGIGAGTPPPAPQGGPYWLGQDVARGVVILPDGSGGYVVDDWGAFHPFVIPAPGHTMPPAPTDGPYWFGKDVVRGAVADTEGNGGYVVDDWGGIHTFSIPGTNGAVPAPSGGPYWPGQDVAHGISVVPQDPPPAPAPPG